MSDLYRYHIAKARCARCNRKLTDPRSVARGVGPSCWAQSGGGAFASSLKVSEDEWDRRRENLVAGGELDFGSNWQYPNEELGTGETMRISVRLMGHVYQAYGHITRRANGWSGCVDEVIFYSGFDLKAACRAAIEAGPGCNAMTERVRKLARKVAGGGASHVRS